MIDADKLYQAVGHKVRQTRERTAGRLSQEKLAKKVGISRVSVVNIEAGRQHAPLYLLWQIAEVLGTDLVLLIPRHDELIEQESSSILDEETLREIELAAEGNPDTEKRVANVISKLRAKIESSKQ